MKKYISIILSVFVLMTILVGCGNNTQNTPNQKEILETDSDTIKITKTVYNELQKYMTGDIAMLNNSRISDIDSETFTPFEQTEDAVIIKDKNRELYTDSNMNSRVFIYTPNGNYVFTENNEMIDVEEGLGNFTTPIYDSYFEMLTWITENPELFEYQKFTSDDNTISYVLLTKDVEYVKEKYNNAFSELNILQFIDDRYEFVYTFDVDNHLVQIDWFATNSAETMAVETSTKFYTNIKDGYKLIGENVENIWDLIS